MSNTPNNNTSPYVAARREAMPAHTLKHFSNLLLDMLQVPASDLGLTEQQKSCRAPIGLALVLFLAFSIEGFCQMHGKQVIGDDWDRQVDENGKKFFGIEKQGIKDKLKEILKKKNILVNWNEAPWSDITKILVVRDQIAHPKKQVLTHEATNVPTRYTDVMDANLRMVWEKIILDIQQLEQLQDSVTRVIAELSNALGLPHSFGSIGGKTSYSFSQQHPPASFDD